MIPKTKYKKVEMEMIEVNFYTSPHVYPLEQNHAGEKYWKFGIDDEEGQRQAMKKIVEHLKKDQHHGEQPIFYVTIMSAEEYDMIKVKSLK